jgi:hypothetical protein
MWIQGTQDPGNPGIKPCREQKENKIESIWVETEIGVSLQS